MNFLRPRTFSSRNLSAKRSVGLFLLAFTLISIMSASNAQAQSGDPSPYCGYANTYNTTMNYGMGLSEVSFDGNVLMDLTITAATDQMPVYHNYSSVQPRLTVVRGEAYAMYARTGEMQLSSGWRQHVKVWIDYNGDGDFLDAGEVAYNSTTNGTTHNFTITIPTDVPATTTDSRMRIASDYYGYYLPARGSACPIGISPFANPIAGNGYGSCRDFTLSFGSLPDAGAIAVVGPAPAYLPTVPQPVIVTVQNFGDGDLNDCDVEYTIDGGAAVTFAWNAANDPMGLIPSGQTRNVVCGNEIFPYKIDAFGNYTTYEITAETKNPNFGSGDDTEPLNNATGTPFYTAPAIEVPASFTFGGASPDWFTDGSRSPLEIAAAYLSAAGILGEGGMEFIFEPGTYDGIINIDGMDDEGTSFTLRSSDPSNRAVLMHSAPSEYLLYITGSANVLVRDLVFEVDRVSGDGGLVNIEDSRDITLLNNIFTVDNAVWSDVSMNIEDSYNVVVGAEEDGNIFYSGGTLIKEYASSCPRKLTVVNNRFEDFYYAGLDLEGANDENCTENDVVVDNNNFTILDAGVYGTMKWGVRSINGTTITNNTFTALKTFTNAYPVASAIYVEHDAGTPTQSDITALENNTITDCENIQGIQALSIPNLKVTDNDIRIKASSNTNMPNAIGISLFECGGTVVDEYVLIKDNKIRVTENGGNMINVTGMYVGDSYVKVYNNDVYTLDNGIHGAAHGAALFDNSQGFVANNWFTAKNGTGVKLLDSKDMKLFYNAINVDAGSEYALEIVGSLGMPAYSNTLMRNLVINQGSGAAALFDNLGTIESHENNFWSGGDYIGVSIPNGMIAITRDGDNNVVSSQTMLDWEEATGTGTWETGTPSSWANEVTFEEFDVLKIVEIDNDIIYDDPISSAMFGYPVGGPEFDDLNAEMQLVGWDGQTRTKFTIGTYNIIPLIEIDLQPLAVVDCWETANHQMSVVAFASGGVQPNYEWFKDGKSLTNLYDAATPDENWANRAILYLDDMVPFRGYETGLSYDMQGVYHCEVTAGAAEPLNTEEVLVAVLRNPMITRQPESMQVAEGATIMLDAEAQIYGGIDGSVNLDEFEVVVQWYDGSVAPAVEIENTDRISGAKSTMLQIKLVEAADYDKKYFVRMQGHCGTVISELVELTPMADVNFTTQPENVVACEGTDAEITFDTELVGGDGTEEIMYSLFKDGIQVGVTQASNTFTYADMTQDQEATYYVLAAVVPGENTEMSTEFTVDVLASATITEIMPAELNVDLADDSGTFTLEVVAEGDGEITYVWEFNEEVVGDAAVYSIESETFTTDDHAGTYRCTVTNECGTDVIEYTVTVVTGGIMMGVEDGTNAAKLSNTPNPVNVETTIEFNAATATSARLVVIDQSGHEVAVLVDGTVPAGNNSVTMNVADYNLASGVYYYTLTIDGTTTTNKLIVVK